MMPIFVVVLALAALAAAGKWTKNEKDDGGGTNDMTRADFLKKIAPLAKVIETQLSIPTEITVTQAAHESNWGTSQLTRDANNLFGITGDSWKAKKKPVIELPTTEYRDGKPYTTTRPFRKYTTWLDSLKDWANLIAADKRYAQAYQAARDHNAPLFFKLVAQAGYATDPRYSEKLVLVRDAVQRELEALA